MLEQERGDVHSSEQSTEIIRSHGDTTQGDAVESLLYEMLSLWGDELVELAPVATELLRRLRESMSGGKGMRSALVLDTHRLLGGARPDAAVHAAAAFELLHTSFLMHDDVIDGDWIRRGRPTLAATYRDQHRRAGAERVGIAAGIVAGDIALHLAHEALARAAARTSSRTRALLQQEFTRAITLSAVGELADVIAEGDEQAGALLSEEISYAKTAAYSFNAPIRTAALLADADPSTIAALTRFASAAGTAFQIQDDLLGVFGNSSKTGKSVDSDMLLGKASLLIAHARSTAAGETQNALQAAARTGDLDEVRHLLEQLGSRRYSEQRIEQLLLEGSEALEHMSNPLRNHLLALLRTTRTRQR